MGNDANKISAAIAHKLAETQFERYRVVQDNEYESDFDKEVKRLNKK